MLKKIFKTIFIMSLCIGISLPTNAAVSVSDGSAFVTKAEFAADLNNLSNRMAQLENSLDAKIDSLVSSYLTRNGIWNGANQILLQDNFKYGFKSSSTRNSAFKKDFNIFNGQNYQNPESLYDYNVIGVINRIKLIDNINKSGMLFFNTYSGTSINGNMTTLPVTTTDRINLANVRWIYEVKYDFEKSTNNNFITMATISSQLIGFGIGTYLYCPNLPVGSITFFVSKGDEIYLNCYQNIQKEPETGNDGSTLGAWVANQESSRTYCIRDAFVY